MKGSPIYWPRGGGRILPFTYKTRRASHDRGEPKGTRYGLTWKRNRIPHSRGDETIISSKKTKGGYGKERWGQIKRQEREGEVDADPCGDKKTSTSIARWFSGHLHGGKEAAGNRGRMGRGIWDAPQRKSGKKKRTFRRQNTLSLTMPREIRRKETDVIAYID